MSVRAIRWSTDALDEYDSAVAHLRTQNPEAAQRYVKALGAAITALARRNTGRPGRIPGTFEKSLPKWRYVIAFQILPNAEGGEDLYIVRVVHTARNWPKGEWPQTD
jgi:plasmid stabilization system protein ParE